MSDLSQRVVALSPAKQALLQKRLNAKAGVAARAVIQRRAHQGPVPLSFAQERFWFLDQFDPGSAVHTIPIRVRLRGELNVPVLERSVNEIVRRHEVLRTRIRVVDGQPAQVIEPFTPLEIPLVDLTNLPETLRENEAIRMCDEGARLPFDLTQDLMLRIKLFRLTESDHVLFLNRHHIASDGWSLGVFMGELWTLYRAFLEGQPSPLPELPIQYADYALWQREWLQGEELEKQLGYWQNQLQGAPELLDLTTDRPRPARQSYRGSVVVHDLPAALSLALGELSRREGVTLFMTLLTAFQILLHRYTGGEDIPIGSPVAARSRTEVEGLLGCFINTLVFRGDLSGNPPFRALLRQTRERCVGAYAHQELQFELLVKELKTKRDMSHSQLFQVMFVLQNAWAKAVTLPALQVDLPVWIDNGTIEFDLTLSMEQRGEHLRAELRYNTDLFDLETPRQMLNHFQTLLEGIVTNPDESIATLPLLTAAEQHQLLVEWNDTATEYPQDKCIHQLFEDQVKRTPNAVAVVFEDRQLTYRELNNRANQLAHYLQKLRVEPDRLVGICVERSLDMIVGLLGILKAGGAYVPIDPNYPQERIEYMLDNAQAKVLLTQQQLVAKLPTQGIVVVCVDTDWHQITQESQDTPICDVTSENIAYVNYTSGSSGKPKGVETPHRGVSRLLFGVNYINLKAENKFLQMAPISFDASTLEIWGALLYGAQCVLFPEKVPTSTDLRKAIQRHSITHAWLTSALFNSIIDTEPKALEGIQQLLTGGEALSVNHVEKANKVLPFTQIINGYGPTEGTTFACCYQIPKNLDKFVQSIPIGRPISNTQIYILDSNLQPVPIGVYGEIYIGGAGLARGYLNRPELTEEKFIPNPFNHSKSKYFLGLANVVQNSKLYKTGDLARYLPDGNIEFFGRLDNQVKIRGFRIELVEIETVLSQNPSVERAVVIMREDTPGEKQLAAYVVPRDRSSIQNQLRDYLKQKLPDYMIPSAFVFLETLPLTPNGKVDRRALPKPEASDIQASATYVAPLTPIEQKLADIWAQVLKLEQVGIHDNFFELGGHSLIAVQLFYEIEKLFGKKSPPLAVLFQAPTIKDLAAAICQNDWEPLWAPLVTIQPKGNKPPLFCIHPVGGNILEYEILARHLGADQPIYGLQAQGLDGNQAPLKRIEDMAALYIEEIRRCQSEGPYNLVGYSFGGLVAFEMAQQLYAQGQQVTLLALLDVSSPNLRRIRPSSLRVMQNYLNNLKMLDLREKVEYIKGGILFRSSNKKKRYQDFLIENGIKQLSPGYINVIESNIQASEAYTAQVYSGNAILFRCHVKHSKEALYPDLGWGELVAGSLEVHHLPGLHHTFLKKEQHVRVLAEKLRLWLEKAQEHSDSPGFLMKKY